MTRRARFDWTPEKAGEFEEAHSRIASVASLAHRAVRPLFRMTAGRPEHVGAGVFVSVRGVPFVFTAAHVLDWFDGASIYAGGHEVMVPLAVAAERTNPPLGRGREEDRIDAAVLKITNDIGTPPGIQFLELAQTDVREWMNPASHYLLYGYPETKTELHPEQQRVAGERLQILVPSGTDADAERAGVHRDLHVVFDIDVERMVSSTGPRAMPSPRGMSGSGVWSIRGLDDPLALIEARLVAIFIEVPPGSRLAVSSRICYHLELIRTAWPELGAHLPTHGKAPIRLRRSTAAAT